MAFAPVEAMLEALVDLSLQDVARVLGKNLRQVRYLVQQGQLKGRKEAGEWRFREEDLPITPGQKAANQRLTENVQQVAQEVLAPRSPDRGFRSVKDLRAFEMGRDIHLALSQLVGSEHPALTSLRAALVQICCGCHEFAEGARRTHFGDARTLCARSVTELLLSEATLYPIADRLERDLLPMLGALLRGLDQRRRG